MKQRRSTTKLLAVVLVMAQLVCLMAMLAVNVTAAAENPLKRNYVFYQADASMLDPATDGKYIKADAWANIPWSETFNLYSHSGTLLDTYSARFQGMWMKDDTAGKAYLYYHIVVNDSTPTGATNWTQDGFVLTISETGEALPLADGTTCFKTSTQATGTTREGNNKGFEYRVDRNDTTGIIDISVRYTFVNADNAAAGKTILLDIMAQNNLGDDKSYQQTAWHSLQGNTYTASENLGKGTLSAVKGNAPVVFKFNDDIIFLMDKGADNKVTLPATYKKVKELLIINDKGRATGAIYSNELLKLVGWKNDSVSYTPGETVTVADTIVLKADMEAVLVDDSLDVLFKDGDDLVASFNKDGEGKVTLPTDIQGKAIAGWLDAEGKLYAPGAVYTVTATEQITLTAAYIRVSTETGASVLMSDPSALRFYAKVNANDMTTYDARIKSAGMIFVETALLTEDILADGIITAAELTEANIAFIDVAAEKAAEFNGALENIADATKEYSVSSYVVVTYEGDSEGRVYGAFEKDHHTRSVKAVAALAYADRSAVKTGEYVFRISNAHAIEPDFPGKSVSPYTEKQLDVLKALAAATANA